MAKRPETDPGPEFDFVARFVVVGTPKAMPRPRAYARKGKDGTVKAGVFQPGTAEAWKGSVALSANFSGVVGDKPLTGPIRLDIDFFFKRPKSFSRHKDPDGYVHYTKKPDRDNLEKPIMDVLTDIGMWVDDSQVCDGRVRKFYLPKGDVLAGCVVVISSPRDQ